MYLNCTNNKLSVLPIIPDSLVYIYCYNNLLSTLPKLPNDLIEILCYNNLLPFLPKFPNSLINKDYSNTPVYTYIRQKCGGDIDIYHRVNEIFATKLVRWYLDCRENPHYKFCRTRLDKEYDDLMDEDIGGIMS